MFYYIIRGPSWQEKFVTDDFSCGYFNKQWTPDEYTRTYLFAARVHKKQTWPGDPDLNYMVHVNLVSIEVIATLQVEPEHDGDLAIKCALLHDVIEDSQVNYNEIKAEFDRKLPRPYGRGVTLLQTSFARHLFYLVLQCMLVLPFIPTYCRYVIPFRPYRICSPVYFFQEREFLL